jgi:hypothetical protein
MAMGLGGYLTWRHAPTPSTTPPSGPGRSGSTA